MGQEAIYDPQTFSKRREAELGEVTGWEKPEAEMANFVMSTWIESSETSIQSEHRDKRLANTYDYVNNNYLRIVTADRVLRISQANKVLR